MKLSVFLFSLVIAILSLNSSCRGYHYDVLIIGGGASGSMAGIQAARMGASTLIVEEGPWLGGMLTSAGVSAIDGNYKLYSGLWEEFRQNLYDYYGGPEGVMTGWVSNVLFEPSVGAMIIRQMAENESSLELMFHHKLVDLRKKSSGWIARFDGPDGIVEVTAMVVIDGTELGDVAAKVGVSYDIGMDSKYDTGEYIAPDVANDVVQDLTYVVVLKDYGKDADKTIPKPENYDPSPFFCSCAGVCDPDTINRILWECDHMLDYGRLPNNKFMINWPIYGNDYYLNVIELSEEERLDAYEKAKWFTRCFIYYIQNDLGFRHLGIADDEFPTFDNFPLIPYHRESRRIHGLTRFTIDHLSRPFEQDQPLYRTGIAVGDYPVDHHHDAANKNHNLIPHLYFYPIPSYTVPLGSLIPQEVDNLIVTEKSISVTNVVNGTTRLQPVCILLGQAAGTLAALAAELAVTPAAVPVRLVQQRLLDSRAYIMPFSEVVPSDSYFVAVQRIGATGIIRGEGKNVGWENFTFFYPDSIMTASAFDGGVKGLIKDWEFNYSEEYITGMDALKIANLMLQKSSYNSESLVLLEDVKAIWNQHQFGSFIPEKGLSRLQMAVLLDELVNPFDEFPVNHSGLVIGQ